MDLTILFVILLIGIGIPARNSIIRKIRNKIGAQDESFRKMP